MASKSIQGIRWSFQILFFFLFVIFVNVFPDIIAESILGCKDNSDPKKFETCEITENDVVEDSAKVEEDEKYKKVKKLFLSEGGWLVYLWKYITSELFHYNLILNHLK